jgi:hypothetical protein
MHSPILYSIKRQAENGGYISTAKMDYIQKLLTTCPNIRELNLRLSWGGCDAESGQLYAFNFTDTTVRLPPLEVLDLQQYDLEGKPNGQKWMEWEANRPQDNILNFPWNRVPQSIIDWVGYPKIESWGGLQRGFVKRDTSPLKPGEKTNLDAWKEVMDWTHLHTLKLCNMSPSALSKLQGDVLPSLKNLEISGSWRDCPATYIDFINNSSPLQSLSFSGIQFDSVEAILEVIIDRHSPQLERLRLNIPRPALRNQYDTGPVCQKELPFFNTLQLTRLFGSNPNIHTPDIEMETKTTWDYFLLDTLASFINLQHLTLRFSEPPINVASSDRSQGKQDEKERMLMVGLTRYLRRKKDGKEFESLRIFVLSREVVNDGGKEEDDSDESMVEFWGDRMERWYDGRDGIANSFADEEAELRALQREMEI